MQVWDLVVILMTKRGITILELLVSMAVISIVILLLIRVVFVLNNINNNDDYASKDEIARAEIIKNIESDFLKLKLKSVSINKENSKTKIIFTFLDTKKELLIKEKEIKYDGIIYKLESKNAVYSLCPKYEFLELDNNYYFINITIPVLIDGVNTKEFDDIDLSYLSLNNGDINYPKSYSC